MIQTNYFATIFHTILIIFYLKPFSHSIPFIQKSYFQPFSHSILFIQKSYLQTILSSYIIYLKILLLNHAPTIYPTITLSSYFVIVLLFIKPSWVEHLNAHPTLIYSFMLRSIYSSIQPSNYLKFWRAVGFYISLYGKY